MRRIALSCVLMCLISVWGFGAVRQVKNYGPMLAQDLELDCKSAVLIVDLSAAHREHEITEKDFRNSQMCLGFVDGFLQGIGLYEGILGIPNTIVCIPAGSSPLERIKVFLKYIDMHPEELHLRAAAVLGPAFSEAFPCDSKK